MGVQVRKGVEEAVSHTSGSLVLATVLGTQ